MADLPSISTLISKPRDEVITFLGTIYENSPWVAETLFDTSVVPSVTSVRDLFQHMKQIVDSSSHEQKLSLLRSHPDLCEKVSSSLTVESQEEQSRAGLDTLTPEELSQFTKWNESYKAKFNFPFILAVRNATKYTVLSAIEGRLHNTPEIEFTTAISQVHKIAWMRLLTKIEITNPKGFLTCHVLDTANGCPASNMRIQLRRISSSSSPESKLWKEFHTNDDGRLNAPALKGDEFQVGVYEWTFFVADYFSRKGNFVTGTPFLDVVPIRFGIDDPEEHYHVPLLVSPWSYSTYRGS